MNENLSDALKGDLIFKDKQQAGHTQVNQTGTHDSKFVQCPGQKDNRIKTISSQSWEADFLIAAFKKLEHETRLPHLITV